MSEPINEQVSALVDGELPPEETALLMRRLAREPELSARLGRYRLIGGVLRGERAVAAEDFAARVSAAIALEPEPTLPVLEPRPAVRRASPFGRFVRPLVGLSVAASVGVLAVMVLGRTEAPVEVARVAAVVPAPAAPREALAAAAPLLPRTAEPLSYVTPAVAPARLGEIPGATLANYVAAHAGVSTPLGGREVLIHLVADPEPRGAEQP
jgi:negative regulator of sigma E activity